MNINRFSSPFLLLILLLLNLTALPAAGQTDIQNAYQSAESFPDLMAEAINATVEEALNEAPGGAITGPVFLDPTFLEKTVEQSSIEQAPGQDVAGAVQSAYERTVGTPEAEASGAGDAPVTVAEHQDIVSLSESSDGGKTYTVADAGIAVWPLSITPVDDRVEVMVGAAFNDDTSWASYRGQHRIEVNVHLVQENGAWRAKEAKVYHMKWSVVDN